MFARVLVANRGEIAVRVIRALHELGIEAVAVYSTADRDALHVELADQAVCIGPPVRDGQLPAHPERRRRGRDDGLRRRASRATASSPRTPSSCAHARTTDVVFIGPPAEVVEQMGDKVRAKEAMRAAGVPLVPGSDGTGGLDALRGRRCGSRVPGPPEGGGRRRRERACGSSPARTSSTARSRAASAEADAAFGDGSVYVEKLVSPARHVEIQVLCDAAGGVLTLGERECSIQRRHQKLIEESPSAALDATTRERDGGYGRARMRGDRLPQRRHLRVPRRPGRRVPLHRGELPPPGRAPRLRARDRDRHRARADPHRRRRAARRDRRAPRDVATRSRSASTPRTRRAASSRRPGTITRFEPPLGPGVRVDTAVRTGSEIPPYYDSLIAKVIVWDERARRRSPAPSARLRELVVDGHSHHP